MPFASAASPTLETRSRRTGSRFQEIGIPAILGTFPAWLTLGESDTWIILVHGKGSDRQAFLRMLPMFVEKGYPTLTITYRNDPGLPLSPTGYYQYGADEWEDVGGRRHVRHWLRARRTSSSLGRAWGVA